MDRLKGKISAILAYRGMVQLGHLIQLTDAIMEVIDQETDIAFNAGIEQAAEIAKNNYKLPCFVDKDYMCYQAGSIAEAIRKEIEK